MGLAWFRLGLWKRDPEKGRCVLCNEDENVANGLMLRDAEVAGITTRQ